MIHARFFRWCRRLYASQARHIGPDQAPIPYPYPVDVSVEDAIRVFLQHHPQYGAYMESLAFAASAKYGATLVLGKYKWDRAAETIA